MTIKIVVVINAAPGQSDLLASRLLALAEPTRLEDGCLLFEVYITASAPDEIVLIEEWTSETAISDHMGYIYTKSFVDSNKKLIHSTNVRKLSLAVADNGHD